MEKFLNEIIEWNKFELIIDVNIFSKNIVLKAAYNFLDRWFFFFKFDDNGNLLLQFTKRDNITDSCESVISDFSDELISVLLRDNLEKENKEIREGIVSAAIGNSLDSNNFVEINTDLDKDNQEQNQIDFDKDIDDILAEIENDPDLKIDEGEIEKILKEIEEESAAEKPAPKLTLDPNAVKNAKEKFQNK